MWSQALARPGPVIMPLRAIECLPVVARGWVILIAAVASALQRRARSAAPGHHHARMARAGEACEEDVHLEPMLAPAQRELHALGVTEPPGVLLADAGYWHQHQMERIVDRGTAVLPVGHWC
jgi:hypothetical protein